MKIKKKMRYLALFIAAVVVFTMLPTNVLEVKAGSDICTCGHFYDDHASGMTCKITGCSCTGFSPKSSSSSSSTSTVTTTVTTEESSEPGISPEEQKRLDDEALQQKLQEMYKKNSRVAVGGRYVTSTLPGAYEATGVKGIAVTTPKEEIVKRFKSPYKLYYKLDGKDYCTTSYRVLPKEPDDKTKEKYEAIMQGSDENVTVETWDVNEKKSPEAYKCLQNAAAQTGGNLGSAFQIKFECSTHFDTADGKATSKHVIELKVKDAIEVKAGLPDDMVGKEVAIAQVVEGGETQILKDQDNDPNTVTFNVTRSEGAYGLVVTNPTARDIVENLTFMRNDQKDALAAYLADKPDELAFIVKFSNANKETLNYYSEHKGLDRDQKHEVADRFYEKYGLGSNMDAIKHLNELRKAAKCKQ